jgi:hypothetical protein
MRLNGISRGPLLAVALCAAVPAGATILPIVNPSFELPLDTSGPQSEVPTGWSTFGPDTDSGVWNINRFPLGSWDDTSGVVGRQVAYLAGPLLSPPPGSQSGIYQLLTCGDNCIIKYDPSLNYTLTGVVGFPALKSSPLPTTRLYAFSLLAGSMELGSVSGSDPVRTLATFTLGIPAGTHAELAGQQLTIKLLGVDAEVVVDNLVLNAMPVPEPDSIALLMLGIGLLVFRLRGYGARK